VTQSSQSDVSSHSDSEDNETTSSYIVNFDQMTFKERVESKIPTSEHNFETFVGKIYNSQTVTIRKFRRKQKQGTSRLKKEARILHGLNHPNIVMFMGISIDKEHFYHIAEHMELGSVYELLHVKKKISMHNMDKILEILDSVAKGMTYLHGVNIIHGNLNSTNILIDEDWNIKISDFGFNRLREKCDRLKKKKKKNDNEISPHWFAPEVFRGDKFGTSSDVYSFGILLW